MDFLNDIPLLKYIILPILDIGLLTYFLFKIYRIVEATRAVQLLRGAIMLALVYAVAWFFQLATLLWILQLIAPGLFIGMAIVFQPELRNIFSRIGETKFFFQKVQEEPINVKTVINSLELLAYQQRGALVVFERKTGLKNYIDTGIKLNADLSSALILTIFSYDGPFHDGAIVIQNGRITAANCFLPLSKDQDIERSFGTRHRAALGMTEVSDAVVLVVSEETGALSLAYDGELHYNLDKDDVQQRVNHFLEQGTDNQPERVLTEGVDL